MARQVSARRKSPKRRGQSRKPAKRGRSRRRSLLRSIAMWAASIVLWLGIATAGLVAYYAYDLPDVRQAIEANTRKVEIRILASDGSHLATSGDTYGAPVRAKDMPRYLLQAIIATEDRRFFDHPGVDVVGILRALYRNIDEGRVVQGGSTISQQVAKNLFLTPERTLKRKVQEALLAMWLESRFSKEQILTIYLNRVYFGAGTYGVDAAAGRYFAKSPKDLTLYESAMIAGLPKAPSRLNPINNPDAAHARTRVVLENMYKAGFITRLEADKARARGARVLDDVQLQTAWRSSRGYFVDWVLENIPWRIGRPDKDLVVHTTLDPALQDRTAAELNTVLNKTKSSGTQPQGAALVLSANGAVRAMVGGRDYKTSKFNRATQALRQPGSAFKPFVYLAGLEAGLGPQSVFHDAPLQIRRWRPRNYGSVYRGRITMAEALAKSSNVVSVRIAQHAGWDNVKRVARRLGITTRIPAHPSMALGTGEVTLVELTAAYAAFANGGYKTMAYAIEEIRDKQGNVLYRNQPSSRRVIARSDVRAMNMMMNQVIKKGTGRRAGLEGRAASGKTGTSQSFRDAWFVGYTPQYVTGVWTGNDDASPMNKVVGGTLPAEVWRGVMAHAHADLPYRSLAGVDDEPHYTRDDPGNWVVSGPPEPDHGWSLP